MSEEFSLVGVLRSIKSSLELSVIDQNKYGPLLITTFSNLAEILLKGFVINGKIKAIPANLNRNQREQQIKLIQDSYKNRKFSTIVNTEISVHPTFVSKPDFLSVCAFLSKLRTEYRNAYTHGFYSYRADIPTETIRSTVEKFIDFLEILKNNWTELDGKISEKKDLKVLVYFCSFEHKNCEQRWRKFNENIQEGSQKLGRFLGVEFDGVRRLLALLDLGIVEEKDFCSRILGYDFDLSRLILPILQTNGQTNRQIQTKMRESGNLIDLRKLVAILDDMANLGKIRKQYENGRTVFLKI